MGNPDEKPPLVDITTYPIQAKTSKSEREHFRLSAESYSSVERVGKKKKKNTRVHFWTLSSVDKFRVLACIGQSIVEASA